MLARLKTLSIKALFWSTIESFSVAVLSLGVFTLMVRLLEPKDFGVVALASAFVISFNLIVAHGFAEAIVQRASLDPEHLDTAFWTNLGTAVLLAATCLVGAEPAARWFGEPQLAEVLPWLSLIVPLSALGIVQIALFRRDLRFRVVALRSLAGQFVGAVVGVGMAISGFGVWSLVGQQIAGASAVCIAVIAASPWRPGLRYSFSHLRSLWRFGFNISASQVIVGFSPQAVNLLIGTILGSVILGYFNIAWRVTRLLRAVISTAVHHVGFSAFARLQEDKPAVAAALLQGTRLSCLIGFPIGAGIATLADPLVAVVFGTKWAATVPILTILAFHIFPAFYGTFFGACYRALDRTGWVLALSILDVVASVAIVLASAPFGIEVVAAAWVAKSFVILPVHLILVRRLLDLSILDLLKPVMTPAVASAVMAGALAVLPSTVFSGMGDLARLLLSIPVGAIIYAGAIFLIAPRLFHTAARTARVMVTPQGASGG